MFDDVFLKFSYQFLRSINKCDVHNEKRYIITTHFDILCMSAYIHIYIYSKLEYK